MSALLMPGGRRNATATEDDPIEMLLACHGKVRRFCDVLERLVEHLPQHGADQQAQDAAAGILRYFDTAAPLHHEDEEEDLFPRLRAAPNAHPMMLEAITELSAEHCYLEAVWQRAKLALEAVVAGNAGLFRAEDSRLFVERYREHAAREEREIFPYAEQLLGKDVMATISRSMVARRRMP